MKIIIIGAGASGLSAAVKALERGLEVLLLEKKEQPGKKLSVTGNGRCNFTNAFLDAGCYRGRDLALVQSVLERVNTAELVSFFRSLCMLETEKNGYYYPANMNAHTVVNALTERVRTLGGEILCSCNVTAVKKEGDSFRVFSSLGVFEGDRVILACGSEASVKDPNAFTAYDILKNFGHTVFKPVPVLVPLFGKNGCETFWDGVRVFGTLSFEDETETGELQLTKEGISGIPAFQLSHRVSDALTLKKKVRLLCDFLPEYSREFLDAFLEDRKKNASYSGENLSAVLKRWIPVKLVPVILKKAGIRGETKLKGLFPAEKDSLLNALKSFSYEVSSMGGMERAQSVSGGVSTKEITDNFESKLLPGLFVTGELLDIDGICGGYNLHFAFAGGMIAGENV